ncbi:MAG: alpha/beta hydrolase [Ignavibacteria bacterium]|nr:alpha/beta hydrolase [Ignavibacteria bacterium]MBT8381321.1 alpha/beta hydrolase [Ignavibacteria bacterium]MBT8391696.1 alpha/beta hydrolase [Ignavibacteria bacterium]NNJ54238.1 alpha/beta hydrolase [Ignavibacteriaceae bacterium]NNL22749.1 alpha/beta hydrolase [Ignavibacteriaceae bacterium]
MKKDFVLISQRNEKIRITTYGSERAPCLIYVHGFKGFKDWGFVPYLGKYLADKGFFVITFNFSHNGIGENTSEFTELEKFGENTFSLEVEELNEVIDAYQFNFFGGNAGKGIGLIGHSRGGAISLLTVNEKDDIGAVAVWASVSKLDRYSERQKEEWRKKGVFEVLNSRTKQVMPLNITLLEDIEQNKSGNLNLEKAVRNLKNPLIILHGEQDLAVKLDEGKTIYSWSNEELTEFYPVESTGHTFDCKHPFEGSNPKFDFVLNKTEEFFTKNIS